MEKLEYLLRFLVPDAMMGLLLFDFCFRLYGKKYKNNWIYLAAYIAFVGICVAVNQLFSTVLNSAYTFVAFMLLSIFLHRPSRRKLFCNVFFMTYCIIVELILGYLMLAIHGQSELSAMMQNARLIWYNLLSKILIYFSYRLVLSWMRHVPNRPLSMKQNFFLAVTSLNCTPFVRQYVILNNKWGALLCQKEYRTRDILQNSKKLL